MIELLLVVTGLVVGISTVNAYRRTADILHPMLFLGPLFFYGLVLDPWLVRDDLDRFFIYPEDLNLVLMLNLLAASALVLGVMHQGPLDRHKGCVQRRRRLTDPERVKLRRLAFVLAVSALAAYEYGIANSGGFVAAFSRAKGGGSTDSGYVGEAMNLGLIAATMVGLARYRQGWTAKTLLLLALALLPNLVQGTFGGRRGPLFLAMAAAMLAWLITRPKTPRVWVLGCSLAATLVAVAFIGSQRQHLYLDSAEGEIRWGDFLRALKQDEIDRGNSFVYGAGFVLATHHSGRFTSGQELAVNLLVRPIPRQLWPSKYEDVGATWVTSEHPGLGHLTATDWLAAVGWLPLQGSSATCISDLFGEFGWGAIVALYLIGRGFGGLRLQRLTHGGLWDLLYLEALMLSIYLATQSFSAFYHRYLILAVPTVVAWKLYVHRQPRLAMSRRCIARVRPAASTEALAR